MAVGLCRHANQHVTRRALANQREHPESIVRGTYRFTSLPGQTMITCVAERESPSSDVQTLDLVIVGGCGHVGLPLAMSFVDMGCSVGIYDVASDKLESVQAGEMPFLENGGPDLLRGVLLTGRLRLSAEPDILASTDTVVLTIGTPLDEFMHPCTGVFDAALEEIAPHLRENALVVIRSTVFPGTTQYVEERLRNMGRRAQVVFCPERVAEGHALEEIKSLPQLIGACTDEGFARAAALFGHLGVEIISTTPNEAELAKLFTNAWRYMRFAIANQFFQIADSAGVDYSRVLHAMRHKYSRTADLPGPGFAAGPCLLKDTMHVAAFCSDHFPLGHAAMLVNEGLPAYIVDKLDARRPLRQRVVGILGMAFKGESDDPRASLSFKLRKLLAFRGATVLATDPYVADPSLVPLHEVLERAEILIVGAPHRVYRELDLPDVIEIVDVWGMLDGRIRV